MWGEFCNHYPLKTSHELEMDKLVEEHNKRLPFKRKSEKIYYCRCIYFYNIINWINRFYG